MDPKEFFLRILGRGLYKTKHPMPRKFVDYWHEKFLIWEVNVDIPCDFCPQPIEKGQHYFETFIGSHVDPGEGEEPGTAVQDTKKRGHIQHLTYAPVVPWEPS